ncbi:carboxylesterase/lipase family protein [Paludibaculum fermentans]|uniref:Carboxylic ester hydrolase n=1 Tax=Paludibaculum fermentans TaxID=1473598 RepID=A0A7S7NXB7_PALFE|nr:carboxylesterase family protein [Paludibaculum fermentans]QOY90914.1 carboxylesterase family protein [Paludibaculum fermentans]
MRTAAGLFLFTLAALSNPTSPAAAEAPVASVTGGSIRGLLDSSLPGGGVFKGIPFARPPVKDLRWREPQPVQPWKGVRDANRVSASCIQPALGNGRFLKPLAERYGTQYNHTPITISEDCLYLNVWAPQWPARNPAPVMVWIHGGSNTIGSGGENGYDGAALARKGVVVVTLNYRLGVLGFFAHPELTRESPHHASGNYGLLDQLAALQWVRQNIAQFGGDPKRVTVFGESAGSINAGLLLCSPLSVGLFQRVILESGPVLSLAHHPVAREKGELFGESVARSLGAPANLQKLRDSSPDSVVNAAREAATHAADPGFVLDGWCLREPPAKIFAEGRQLPVDLMIGNNGREMSVFRGPSSSGSANRGLAGDSVKETIRIFYAGSASVVTGLFVINNVLGRTESADSWINDVVCACPAMAMSLLNAGTGHPAYVYQFLRSIPGKGEKTLGSFHSLELPYVFGAFRKAAWNWLPFEPVDYALGESIMDYWTNFAKTGNPNGPKLPNWPAFDAGSQASMEFTRLGQVQARAKSRPAFCDLDVKGLRARLK